MIRAAIFDFNGVLVDDEMVHFALFRDVLAERGIGLTEDRYHAEYLGLDDRGCFEAALGWAGRPFDRAAVDALIAAKADRYLRGAEAGLRIFPGAAEVVSAWADRGPVAICSGALRGEIEFALGRMGVRDRVTAIVSAEDTERCKPDPEGYLKALTLLRGGPGLADLDPQACLVIEDSLAGIASALGAGMRAVGVGHTYRADELIAAGAHAVVAELAEVTPDWAVQRFLVPMEPAAQNEAIHPGESPSQNEPTSAAGLAQNEATLPVGLLLSRDLIFTSKVTGTASALGRKVVVAGQVAQAVAMIERWGPKVVFVDLGAGELVASPGLLQYRGVAAEGTPFLAFGSHVDVEALAEAARAGCDPVMPRSRFTAELPALIRRYLGEG